MKFNVTILCARAVTFLSLASVVVAVLPNGECSASNKTCELENNNVIGILNGIYSVEECRQQCLDNNGFCTVFSHYNSAGAPFRDTCILLSDCLVLDTCVECYTEDVRSDCTVSCTAAVEGIIGDNLVDFAVDLTKEACASECEDLLGCDAYTYHFGNSTTYPETCFLLTELLKPLSLCDDGTCLSGSPECNLFPCGFRVDGVFYPNIIVVNATTDIDVISDGSCDTLLAVAVGGGGTTSVDAGSGSGYVEFAEISPLPSGQLRAEVGGPTEVTKLTDRSDGTTLLTANPGGDGGQTNGADGYSGGGGDTTSGSGIGGGGGTDGGDGEDSSYPGGMGSALDITGIPLAHVVISPGDGGQGDYGSGGGGGGVIVDGRGPIGGGPQHGEGFGAGGGGYWNEVSAEGYPGIIILELS